MQRQTLVVRTVAELRKVIRDFHAAGDTVGLVPTMGALHDGHIALVREARRRAARVVTTIFVNPTQFAPTEDLAKYPRTEAADLARLEEAGCDVLFAPASTEIYPAGFATTVSLEGPATVGLEDRFRPTHFAGVATVVAKLFTQSAADTALFGEKDYQQLCVVTRMARDLDLPIEVIGVPTVRESDGLAMSSRNRYLSPDERAKAPLLHRTLAQIAAALLGGTDVRSALSQGRHAIAAAGFALDYLEARHAISLAPVSGLAEGPVRLLVAARLGTTRLIDNIAVETSGN
ncbi:pantoate--beta-alanine ligase [Labrys neptuniae]